MKASPERQVMPMDVSSTKSSCSAPNRIKSTVLPLAFENCSSISMSDFVVDQVADEILDI